MRAVILEVRGRSATVMTENGGVEKVPALPGWETGMEVLLPAAPKKHPLARLYGGIAAFHTAPHVAAHKIGIDKNILCVRCERVHE